MKIEIAALSTVFVFAASGAHADALPAATASSNAMLVGGSADTNAYATTSDFAPNNISVSGFVSGSQNIRNVAGPVPYTSNTLSLSAPVSYDSLGRQNGVQISGGGDSYMTYWAEILGAPNSTPILIDIKSSLNAHISGGGQAWAAISIQGPGLYGPDGTVGGQWHWEVAANDFGVSSTSTSMSPNVTAQVLVGQPFLITMGTHTDGSAWNGPGYGTPKPSSFASAYADPYFAVDSSTPDASSYSFLFSDGVGNAAAAAPSPATGTGAIGLGLLALVGLLKARRKNQAL